MLDGDVPGSHYWSLVETVWLRLNRTWDDVDEFFQQFAAVRPEIGNLYAAHWCQSEVCNGGFHQFFSNTTGLLAPEALAGFRAIALYRWAEILDEAMRFFGNPYPRHWADRDELLNTRKGRRREEWDPFDKLDDEFYKWLHAEPDRWERAADQYAIGMSIDGKG